MPKSSKIILQNEEIQINNIELEDKKITFDFDDNDIELFKNKEGTIYYRDGRIHDLGIKINGFKKEIIKVDFNEEDNIIKLHFKDE